MIELLTGIISQHSPTFLILDVQGVGYGLNVSLSCSRKFPLGAKVSLPCHLVSREDALELYAFADLAEKEVWKALITVNGIGPRTAQRILSEAEPYDLVNWIIKGNLAALVRLKGVGKKTAEIMLLELKSKLAKLQGTMDRTFIATLSDSAEEAILALTTLGLREPQARKAVESVLLTSGAETDLSRLISLALQKA